MAAPSSKRPLPAKVAAMKARKRQKLSHLEASGSKPDPRSNQKSSGPKKVQTRLDALAWKSIDMPENLDDYEGFFGLEEVDDVDVVRDAGTGVVRFEARPADAKASGPSDEEMKGNESGGVEPEEDGDGDEWEGFGDEEIESNALGKANGKSDQKLDGPAKNQTPQLGSKPRSQSTGAFAGLQRDDDEGEEEADISAWRTLNVSTDTLSSLSKLKFSTPTPIQRAAIPEILAGHDVIGKASTGSGKTLAFGIPILEEYLERRNITFRHHESKPVRSPLALILSPTRELAHQLDTHLTALCSNGTFEAPSIATLTGGLSILKQQRQLKYADIVIGTPGRLWEIVSESKDTIRALKGIQFLVIDEADRLLSQGNFKEVEEILNALERKDFDENGESTEQPDNSEVKHARQTLIFSATFDRGLQRKLSNKSQPNSLASNKESLEYLVKKLKFHGGKPKFIDVNPINQLATGLKEGLIECSGMEKDLYLYTLLLMHPNTRALVFANSISAVRRLTPLLQHLNLPALPLHSGMIQKARLRSVERFTTQSSNGKAAGSILVATDVAARGLDIPDVQLIIHYHLPRAADTYVHRSGRTARAGQAGSSILICSPDEVAGVRRLVAKVHASSTLDASKQSFFIRTLDLDRRLVSRLKPRATLAKKIADAELAKTKGQKEDSFLRAAAEELGVDYDSEDDGKGKRGRGAGRMKKEKESREMTKAEVGGMKAELRSLLAKRVNVGVSERYLTSSGLDVDKLLQRRETDGRDFLGSVGDIGL